MTSVLTSSTLQALGSLFISGVVVRAAPMLVMLLQTGLILLGGEQQTLVSGRTCSSVEGGVGPGHRPLVPVCGGWHRTRDTDPWPQCVGGGVGPGTQTAGPSVWGVA